MAEFQVVMQEVHRMCREHGSTCMGCPVFNFNLFGTSSCKLKEGIYGEADFEKIEAAVMKWAEEHPLPAYPNWNEWQSSNFPNADGTIKPCMFLGIKEMNRINGTSCEQISCWRCANNPIPADTAEKLGIKPIGVSSDA